MKQLSVDIKKKGVSLDNMKINTPAIENCGIRSSIQVSQ